MRLHEKGGKRHEMPAHHNLEAYLEAAKIVEAKKTPLFHSARGRTGELTQTAMHRIDAYCMIRRRRARDAGLDAEICCHTFRATGITAFLENGGTVENAQAMAAHESPRTTKLYDRTGDEITLDEVERIAISSYNESTHDRLPKGMAMDLNSINNLPSDGSSADDRKEAKTVATVWLRRLHEVSAVTREHERQMALLRSSPHFMAGTRFDNEATRALARLREQTSFLENVNSPLRALAAQIPGQDLATRIAELDLRRLSDSLTGLQTPYSGISEMLARGSAFDQAAKAALGFADRFRVPSALELFPLLSRVPESIWTQYGLPRSNFELAAANVRSPWLDTLKQIESVTSLAKLHGIRHLIAARPYFDLEAAAALRIDLGDWRDRFSMPDAGALDIPVRTAFYVERGYNPSLADFPTETFESEVADLRGEMPVLVSTYGEPVPPSDDTAIEATFQRNNLIYNWLLRFETQIREFIDTRMTAEYGSDWPQHKLPNGLYEKWVDKKNKDKSGSSWPLIYYADFTDYELIITRADNWKAIFVRFFKRTEHVRESLQRLYLPRLATMHARPLTQDDELFVYSEVKRITQVFLAN